MNIDICHLVDFRGSLGHPNVDARMLIPIFTITWMR